MLGVVLVVEVVDHLMQFLGHLIGGASGRLGSVFGGAFVQTKRGKKEKKEKKGKRGGGGVGRRRSMKKKNRIRESTFRVRFILFVFMFILRRKAKKGRLSQRWDEERWRGDVVR